MMDQDIRAQYRIYKLGDNEQVKSFDCGDVDLNDFILNDAFLYRKEKFKNFFLVDNKTGCRFITVDAYAEAVPFYVKNGFVPLNEDDINERTRLLYFDLKDLETY